MTARDVCRCASSWRLPRLVRSDGGVGPLVCERCWLPRGAVRAAAPTEDERERAESELAAEGGAS